MKELIFSRFVPQVYYQLAFFSLSNMCNETIKSRKHLIEFKKDRIMLRFYRNREKA